MKQRIKIAMISIDLSRTGISTVMMNCLSNHLCIILNLKKNYIEKNMMILY